MPGRTSKRWPCCKARPNGLDARCVATLEGVLEQIADEAPFFVAVPTARPTVSATPVGHEEPVATPLLPSVPTVFAGSSGRIVTQRAAAGRLSGDRKRPKAAVSNERPQAGQP